MAADPVHPPHSRTLREGGPHLSSHLGWPHLGSQEGPGHDFPSRGGYSRQEREGSSPGWLVWQVLDHEDIPGRGEGGHKGRGSL